MIFNIIALIEIKNKKNKDQANLESLF